MKQYDLEEVLCAMVITLLVAFFSACQLMQSYQVDPLKKEAIKRGYAEYRSTNTTEQTTTKFTWK
jgi:hypothetical protein